MVHARLLPSNQLQAPSPSINQQIFHAPMDSPRRWTYTSAQHHQGSWHECPGAHDANFQRIPTSEMTPTSDVDWDIDSMLAQCMWDVDSATASSTPPDDYMSPLPALGGYLNTQSAHFSSWSLRTPSRSAPEASNDMGHITNRKERRRAQNRKAQSAFRQRKDRMIGILEEEVRRLNGINQSLTNTNDAFKAQVAELRATINAIQSASLSIPSPTSNFPYEITAPEVERKGDFASPCGSSPTMWSTSPQTSRQILPHSGVSSKKKPVTARSL